MMMKSEMKQMSIVRAAINQLDWFKNNMRNIREHVDVQYYTQQ